MFWLFFSVICVNLIIQLFLHENTLALSPSYWFGVSEVMHSLPE